MNAEKRKRIAAVRDKLTTLKKTFKSIEDEITDIRNDEQESYDNLSDAIQQGDRGQTMQTAVSNLEEASSKVDEMGCDIDSDIRDLEAAEE